MTTQAIKREFHELIDKIDNQLLLEQFYKALSYSHSNSKFELWDSLNETQRQEIIDAFEESNNDNNLINFEDIKAKHKAWLSK